ncbi:glycosyltransferase family 4 protein [Candidatus Uhrbacteria bacterium]|nr:glycosyltransferase family 4 protein [Candidatus Uhrbacteria bacterium]
MMKKIVLLIQSILMNLWSNHSGYRVTHIVEINDWAIKYVGTSLSQSFRAQHLLHARISYTAIGLRNQLIHFDSVNTFFHKGSIRLPHRSNKIILTWFHVEPGDPRLNLIQQVQRSIGRIHTSCQTTKAILIKAGVAEEKIVVIPLGVDLDLFRPGTHEERLRIRRQLGIPENRLVIGSFQKDGVGWREGMEPKLIKGPDVFVEVIDRLREKHPFVLLSGPARGYVKQGLERLGVDYVHVYPKNFSELPKLYQALDLYLITSRVEGGPLSLLESWASEVPVVSTRMGMVPDIAEHEHTALLTDVENVDALVRQTLRLINDQPLRHHLVNQALTVVKKNSWDNIARRYVDELYRPLL